MGLLESLRTRGVLLALDAADRDAVVRALVDAVAPDGVVSDREAFLRAVSDRELQGSTSIGGGVAVPHAKCEAVSTLFAAVATTREPLLPNGPDGLPVAIFFLVGAPQGQDPAYIRLLAEIARLFKNPAVRARFAEARTVDDLRALMADESGAPDLARAGGSA